MVKLCVVTPPAIVHLNRHGISTQLQASQIPGDQSEFVDVHARWGRGELEGQRVAVVINGINDVPVAAGKMDAGPRHRENPWRVIGRGHDNLDIEHRTCFSCHHQAQPLMTLVAAKTRGFAIDARAEREILDFSLRAFAPKEKHERLR